MKINKNGNTIVRLIINAWEGLVDSPHTGDLRKYRLSRVLNLILIILVIWGLAFEVQSWSARESFAIADMLVLVILVTFALAYYINRKGYLVPATVLTLALLAGAIFAWALIRHWQGGDDFSVFYYLIIAILIGELFLSMRGYFTLAFIILIGVFGISVLNPNAAAIFNFLFIFCLLIGFFSYYHRSIEREQILLAGKVNDGQLLLQVEQQRSAQLGLLEEVGRQIADSFDEKEIFQRSIDAVVNRFGYAEAAISILVEENMLEIIAIAGTQDFGYRPGFRQKLGTGIIGHTAEIRSTYISRHVASDPYYFSNEEHQGSAIGIPILNEKDLFGVLYVESARSDAFSEGDAATLETLANQLSASIQRARLYSNTREHLRIISTVQAVSSLVSTTLDLERIFESVVKELKQVFGYTHVSIYLLKEDFLYLGAQIGYPKEMVIRKIHISQGVSGRTIKSKQAQFLPDVTTESNFLRAANEVFSEICVPLLKDNMVLGTINVEGDKNSHLTQADVDMLTTLAVPIALAVDNARLHEQVKAMALTDAVSGLFNRHAFEEMLIAEIQRSTRLGHPVSLIIFDLDSFKDYNDTWGHPAGDIRLKATADLIRNKLRKYDIAARYGGDEFAIILPNTNQESALILAQRLHGAAQSSTAEHPLNGKGVSGYTLSMGIATFPSDGNTHLTLLLAADHAELMAKRLGKNQIFLASNIKI